MTRFVTRWACWGLLLAVVGMMGGCPDQAPSSDPDGGTNNGQSSDGDDGNGGQDAPDPTDCGERTVNSFPGPGFVEMEWSFQLDAVPADSELFKVLLGVASCQQQFDAGNVGILYEVGQQGEVLALITLTGAGDQKFYIRTDPSSNQRFVVEDGCLTFKYDFPDEYTLPDFDPTEIPQGPCGVGQMAIGRDGQIVGEPVGAYICVEANFNSACHHCWVADGAWHEEYIVKGSYVALGSIDNVSVSGWAAMCDQADEPVSIRSGERVDFTWTMGTTYRTSPSPEELGYQPFELPTTP